MTTDALLGPLGLLAGCLLAIGAFVTGRVVTRAHLNDVIRLWEKENADLRLDRDFWRQIALSGTSLAAKSFELAKTRRRPHGGGDEEAPG